MKTPLQRITITFLLIALLPIGFMVYELGLLSKNEKIVREAYHNQLDAILYSVNQYSDDIISSWANRIRQEVRNGLDDPDELLLLTRFRAVLNQTDVAQYIYFSDLAGNATIYRLCEECEDEQRIKAMMDQVVGKNRERIDKLIAYERAGFRKMEAIDTIITGKSIPIVFVLDEGESEYGIGCIITDLPGFIENNLAPKMQAISQEKFIVSAFQFSNDSLIYSTESVNFPGTTMIRMTNVFHDKLQKTDFWLLPGYYLGITLKAATIEGLVKERTVTSVIILVLLIVTLAAGMVFLQRNIRREIHLSQAKSEFVSNVSHEIRTPLSLIGMFAETLAMDRVNSEEKKKEYYQIIGKETARLTRIVNRILNFSQLEASRKRFTFGAVRLNDLCTELLESYFYHWKEKGFVFSFSTEDDLPAIQGDREALSEAVINLLDNAIKYSRDKKHIRVHTGCVRGQVFVEISDEGIGIEKRHQREIFDQFYRAPTGDVHTTKGTGLGLTLVKKIMEAHHGTVTVISTPGKGSTFRLEFPLNTTTT